MNILHLTTHLNRGGISKYILSLGGALRERGHRVYVASSGGETEDELKTAGIILKTLPIRTKSELSPKIYRSLPELIHWIMNQKIDLVHAHTRITQVMAFWLHWLTRKPFVTTAHGFYKRRLGRRILPAWGERAIAISDAVATDLQESHRVHSNRIRLVYNGLNLEELVQNFLRYDPVLVRREYGFSEDASVVGIIARLVPDKGHEYLIQSVKMLESEIPSLQLLIVGDGRYRDNLEQLARRLNLSNRIYFTGNLKDVSKPLAAIDVFAMPAVWREGFGLSIVEAMACQKPVIVTNIWALNTLIQNRVNGILVEPRNVEDLAHAIRLILKDLALKEKIGKAGQETAQKRFSLDRMVQEVETVYEEVLRG